MLLTAHSGRAARSSLLRTKLVSMPETVLSLMISIVAVHAPWRFLKPVVKNFRPSSEPSHELFGHFLGVDVADVAVRAQDELAAVLVALPLSDQLSESVN